LICPSVKEKYLFHSPLREKVRSKIPSFDWLRVVNKIEPPEARVRGIIVYKK
jgi:hypothetical protein